MLAELTAFNQGVRQLRDYIEGLELETTLLKHNTSGEECSSAHLLAKYQTHQAQGINKRRFDYSTVVVSLYGYLEQYLEGLLRSYTECLNAIVPKFSDLPKEIASNHLSLSMKLMDYMFKTKHQFATSEADIISNLHSCNVDTRYVLNKDAFAHHTANFREEVINYCFNKLEINNVCERVKKNEAFVAFISGKYPGQDPMSFVEDLAERRNQVSHGEINDLLQNPVLLQYLEVIEAFGNALFTEIHSELLSFEARHLCVPLGRPYHVYDRGGASTIPCLELLNVSIKVGDELIVVPSGNGLCFEGALEEITMNKVSHNEIIALPTPQRVGMKVNFRATVSQTFHLRRRLVPTGVKTANIQLTLFLEREDDDKALPDYELDLDKADD